MSEVDRLAKSAPRVTHGVSGCWWFVAVALSCNTLGAAASARPIEVPAWRDVALAATHDTAGLAMSQRIPACLDRAADHFGLHPPLVHAIAEVESAGNPKAVNRSNRNGSRDLGLMQINSAWLPKLARWQISEQALFEPCISAFVGAWILADNIQRLGPVWRAVGAYNARSPERQLRYVRRVQAVLARQYPGQSRQTSSKIPGR